MISQAMKCPKTASERENYDEEKQNQVDEATLDQRFEVIVVSVLPVQSSFVAGLPSLWLDRFECPKSRAPKGKSTGQGKCSRPQLPAGSIGIVPGKRVEPFADRIDPEEGNRP